MLRDKNIPELLFDILNPVLLIVFCITIIYPFVNQLTLSLSTPEEALKFGLKLYPKKISLASYKRLFSTNSIYNAYYYTILRVVLGTSISLLITMMWAYPLAKKYLLYRNFWTGIMVFTMFFSGGLIPTYLLVRNLGLIDTIWALVLPGTAAPFNVIIARNYMMSISESLEENAKLEGANDVIVFSRIILPISKPIIAVLALWLVVGHWNAWFDALIYINSPNKMVLQTLLRKALIETNVSYSGFDTAMEMEKTYLPETIRAAILIVTTLPILCIYPFLQKYFVKGIMIGSLKG